MALARAMGTRVSDVASFRDNDAPIGGAIFISPEDTMTELDRAVARSIEYAVFGGPEGRREFIKRVGAATASAALAAVFPVEAAKALAQDKPGPLEKRDLK